MSNSERTNGTKTKAQVQQELTEVKKTLNKQTNDFKECRESLNLYESESNELKSQISQLQEEKRELQAKLIKQVKQYQELKEDFDEEKQIFIETKKKDTKQLQEIEEESSKKYSKKNIELKEAERLQNKIATENKSLKKALKEMELELQSYLEPVKGNKEGIQTPSSTFIVNMYPYEGTYQGKIMHPLSKENKALNGLDKNAITDFIASHLPKYSENANTSPIVTNIEQSTVMQAPLFSETIIQNVPQPKFDLSPGKNVQETKIAAKNELFAVPIGSDLASTKIHSAQPFKILINLDLSDTQILQHKNMNYNVQIYATKLGDKIQKLIGQVQGKIASETTLPLMKIKSNVISLPAGIYRLEAGITFKSAKGTPVPFGSILEGTFLQLY